MLMAAILSPSRTHGQEHKALSFSPSPGSFGSVTVGSSKTLTVTVKNTGWAPVKISAESVYATGFSVSGLTVPQTISGGGYITLSVKFAPTSTGLFSGYVLFTSNATNGSAEYSVNGTGVLAAGAGLSGAGTIATTPSSVSFGTVANGTTNSQTVQLKNTGGTSVTISNAMVSGTGFTLSGISLPLTLAAAQTSNFTVAFAPTASGSVTGSVTINSNAANPAYAMALSGTGASATRTISLGSSNLNFGNEIVGGTSSLQLAVQNTGNSSLTISQINVTGTGFSVGSGVSGSTVAAGQTAELNVAFAPKATGSVSGTVTLISNATNSPNSAVLTGTGVSSTTHSVALSWAASSSSGIAGYYVYRSTVSGSSYTRITSAVLNTLNFTDGAVSAGNTYYYVVTAVNPDGTESAYSGQVTAVIP
jgi:ASPM-SPD-2-Hydin domain-containing protein/centrosomal CEP192-like protein/HYDIN/CFA65/VesB family protein